MGSTEIVMFFNGGLAAVWCISYYRQSEHRLAPHKLVHWGLAAGNLWCFLMLWFLL